MRGKVNGQVVMREPMMTVWSEEVEVVDGVGGDTRSGEEQPLAPTTHFGGVTGAQFDGG